MSCEKQPVCLLVLDGWGYREAEENNAIAAADTPNFDRLWSAYPHTLLDASGAAVGLPDGQMGNSEVGHTTIGAGQAIETDLKRIGDTAERHEFTQNRTFREAFENVKQHDSTLHILGLIGNGGVHAHGDHLHALLDAANEAGVERVAIHAFTDGRDSGTQEAAAHVQALEEHLKQFENGHVASVSGRYFAMDRDRNLDRQRKAEAVIIDGASAQSGSASQFVSNAYSENISDEHITPQAFTNHNGDTTPIQANDSVIFMNFRADRAIQLSESLGQIPEIYFATLTDYGPSVAANIAFPSLTIETTLAAEISRAGLTQAHIAESEKGPHATYFLNGKQRTPHPRERHDIVKSFDSSDGIDTHDQKPNMRVTDVAQLTIERIEQGTDFIFTNFANPDMVGHTANVPAIIEALETVDTQLNRIAEAMLAKGGILLATADHGNAELNVTPEGNPHTAHTTNLVPFIAAGIESATRLRDKGTLADIAPTTLSLLGIDQPQCMTGQSLILKHQ